jgi:hypothetical protein|tara:strand:+ start:432 stop:584 length:153 start_codon:yes stop_codon:yes gene_type:complete
MTTDNTLERLVIQAKRLALVELMNKVQDEINELTEKEDLLLTKNEDNIPF